MTKLIFNITFLFFTFVFYDAIAQVDFSYKFNEFNFSTKSGHLGKVINYDVNNIYSVNFIPILFQLFDEFSFDKENKNTDKSKLYPYYFNLLSWKNNIKCVQQNSSSFFGIEFDLSFVFKGGVVRIGDSSEEAVRVIVSLYR